MESLAIILASGKGIRFENKTNPKHLTEILGVPVLVWTIDNIINSNLFFKVILVCDKSTINQTKKTISQYFSFSKDYFHIVEGAESRMGSFFNGLKEYDSLKFKNKDIIISLFDANRPFISREQIQKLYNNSVRHGCSCPARPVVNGVARIKEGRIIDVPKKEEFIEFVTPEFIKFSLLKSSVETSKSIHKCFVEYALAVGIKPVVCESSLLNTKLTYPNDKALLENIALEYQLEKPKEKH